MTIGKNELAAALLSRRWVWKQRVAVTGFLLAFRVRRLLRFVNIRCGWAGDSAAAAAVFPSRLRSGQIPAVQAPHYPTRHLPGGNHAKHN